MENNLTERVRVNGTTCLGPCESGVNIVVYPDSVFYAHVTAEDIPEIVSSHLKGGKPVERLIFKDDAPAD